MNDQDIKVNRQINQVRDERMLLRDELTQMEPSGWRQDAGMNEVPVWSTRQRHRRDEIARKLEQLQIADNALYRHPR